MGLWLHRLRRLAASGSPVLFAGTVALAGLAISEASGKIDLSAIVVYLFLALSIFLLGFQMTAEYWRRTYDPTLMTKFDGKFDGEEMRRTRSKAAQALKDDHARLSSDEYASSAIDDILDFFEAVGFFMQGDQITPEVAHHAFHYWIRGYYSAAKEYLETAQRKEPSNWECVERLFKITNEVERERAKKRGKREILLDDAGIAKFLEEEIGLQRQQKGKDTRPSNTQSQQDTGII